MLSIGGDNLQFYPNFALFSTLGGMKLDHDFFHVSKLSEDQKKGLHQKLKEFLSPKSRGDQRKGPNIIQPSDANHTQIIGGDADVDHSQITGRIQSNLLGGYIPLLPPHRVSAPLAMHFI